MASREVAVAGKPGQRVGPDEEAGQMVESQGSGGIQNLWPEETRSMGVEITRIYGLGIPL